MDEKTRFASIDEYIDSVAPDIQVLLKEIRQTVHAAAPEVTEKMSYGMPAFALKGNLVYFAAWKNHIGFYALPSGNEAFRQKLSHYKTGKGSVQFPLEKEMPWKLIGEIVTFRIKEIQKKQNT